MASSPIPDCFIDGPPIAAEVARGVTRLFCRHDLFAMCEVPLPNGRRADLMAIGPRGELTIVEIKVSRADLMSDQKWTDYLEYCDRFFWAVPQALAPLLEEARRDGDLDFDDPKLTALAACSLPGFLYSWYKPDGRYSIDDLVAKLCVLTWRLIGLRQPPAATERQEGS